MRLNSIMISFRNIAASFNYFKIEVLLIILMK